MGPTMFEVVFSSVPPDVAAELRKRAKSAGLAADHFAALLICGGLLRLRMDAAPLRDPAAGGAADDQSRLPQAADGCAVG
jgi:hypothetical protein